MKSYEFVHKFTRMRDHFGLSFLEFPALTCTFLTKLKKKIFAETFNPLNTFLTIYEFHFFLFPKKTDRG